MQSNGSRRRFWNFFDSFSDSTDGVSIPMNTRQKFALTIASNRSDREARSIEASVKNPNGYRFPPAELQKRVEFSNQLRRGLRPRTASVQRDDVAKITGERAASRKLHRHGTVFF